MVHTYSLIHDDLPCMDNDDYRRGRLTNHKVFGEALAVLAGDGLLTAAFETASMADADPAVAVKVIRILSEQAGELGMVGGQVLDMDAEEQELTEQGIYDIQRRKTGALIQAACQIGVVAGGGTEQQLQAAGTYAQNIGLAFQIRDDMLDVLGDAAEARQGHACGREQKYLCPPVRHRRMLEDDRGGDKERHRRAVLLPELRFPRGNGRAVGAARILMYKNGQSGPIVTESL